MLRRHAALSVLPFLAASSAFATDAATLWATKVQPLFDVQCVKCHGPIEQKSGLELDTPEAVFKGGENGKVIVPGKPEESPLYEFLAPKADPHMPPKKQLTDAERAIVKEWIAALTEAPKPVAEEKPAAPREFASVTEAVDTLIAEGWARRKMEPAKPVDDHTWCRRVYLDLAGRIPTAAEADAFQQSKDDNRRAVLVDKLLAAPEYAVRMRELWDAFLMGRGKPGDSDKRRQVGWNTFLEASFRQNRPWNETVREFLVARPEKPENKGATRFLYERKNDYQRIAEAVSPVIYGTKIDCAQCHDHPLAREIKQGHYWGLVTAFNRSKNVENSDAVEETAIGGYNNFTNLKKESQPALVMMLTGRTLSETWPSGDQKEADGDDRYVDPKAKPKVPKYSRREAFADAVTHDNPLLARAFVNRMWAAFTGRGIVHPADEMSGRNVPSHPELLDWLAKDFAQSNYNVHRFVRGIVLSRTYALGAGETADATPEAFAAALERPLTAEQIARSWRVASGVPANDGGLERAVIKAMPDVMPAVYNATFQQAHFLEKEQALEELLKAEKNNTLKRLTALPDSTARVREAFLAVFGRQPDAEESAQAIAFLSARPDHPSEAARDLLWALLSSGEFFTMP